jgi:hypothetical protein
MFHLPAKFKFAPPKVAPLLVSCYHLSATSISSCREELREHGCSVAGLAGIQTLISSDLQFNFTSKRADDVAADTD